MVTTQNAVVASQHVIDSVSPSPTDLFRFSVLFQNDIDKNDEPQIKINDAIAPVVRVKTNEAICRIPSYVLYCNPDKLTFSTHANTFEIPNIYKIDNLEEEIPPIACCIKGDDAGRGIILPKKYLPNLDPNHPYEFNFFMGKKVLVGSFHGRYITDRDSMFIQVSTVLRASIIKEQKCYISLTCYLPGKFPLVFTDKL